MTPKHQTITVSILTTLVLIYSAYVHAQVSVHVVFRNKCADIDPQAPEWICLNRTQASQRPEILRQIKLAIKNTHYTGNVTIVSIDPIMHGRWKDGVEIDYQNVDYEFGAWLRGGKIYFSAMSSCPNARWELERILRGLR